MEHRIPKLLNDNQIKKLKLSKDNVLDYLIIKEFLKLFLKSFGLNTSK